MHKKLQKHQKTWMSGASHPGVVADPPPGGRYHFSQVGRSRLRTAVGSYLLLLFLLLGSLPLLANGSEEGAVERDVISTVITTAQQLSDIRNDLSGSYKLGADIDLSGISNWVPIGDLTGGFTGSLDGAGFKITGLKIDGARLPDRNGVSSNANAVGLFGSAVDGAVIKNLALEVTSVEGRTWVGGLIGRSRGATVENVYVYGGTVIANGDADLTTTISQGIIDDTPVGGLIGRMESNVTNIIKNSYVHLTEIKGKDKVGGLIG